MTAALPKRLQTAAHSSLRLYHFERIEQCLHTPRPRMTNHIHKQQHDPTCTSRRSFSSSTYPRASAKSRARDGGARSVNLGGNPMGKIPSLGLQMKQRREDMMANAEVMLQQFGMIPGTFVPLDRADRPSWTSDAGTRWLWEKARLRWWRMTVQTFLSARYVQVAKHDPAVVAGMPWYKRWYTRLFDRPGLRVRGISSAAEKLYSDVYKALAWGDTAWIEEHCRPTFAGSLRDMIRAREKGTGMTWSKEGNVRRPRLVSWTVAVLDPFKPAHRQTLITQAVVRLQSRQVLEKKFADGTQDKGQTKEVKEWFVVQSVMVDGVWKGEKAWGMTKPTTIEEIKAREEEKMALKA